MDLALPLYFPLPSDPPRTLKARPTRHRWGWTLSFEIITKYTSIELLA